MQLTDEHIAEFQMLYKKHFGAEISKEQALEKGLRLIRLMEITAKHEDSLKNTDNNKNSYGHCYYQNLWTAQVQNRKQVVVCAGAYKARL